MSKKQWLVLLMLFLTYLLLGASIFYHIESRLEIESVAKAKQERIEINALLHEHYIASSAHDQHEILEKLTVYCGKSVYNYTEGDDEPLKWDFYNSFYFAYTVVSTIGYGNLAPTNMLSRILMIFYGLVGIPMNGILLTQLGEFFGLVFVRAHRKYKSYKKQQSDYRPKKFAPLETRKAGLAVQILMYLVPGFLVFIFFPAFLFTHYEGWTYDEAVYYAFVTLTTIGFGDLVAGQDNRKGSGIPFVLYKTFLICWISFGLGYIVMIMTFIARGMRSKQIIRIEHKLAMNIKHTQSKIWNEFNREVDYLRRVFNELQLSKVKRVYVNESDYEEAPAEFPRSSSFPDLRSLSYGGLESAPPPPRPRRRANSEVVPAESQLTRVVSETDLQRIDKNATFAAHAMVQPAELLARLVNILGYVPPPQPSTDDDSIDWEKEDGDRSPDREQQQQPPKTGGIDGFPEKEILASESTWSSLQRINEKFPAYLRPRSRAASEVRLSEPKSESGPRNGERNVDWTWSGPTATKKIQELIRTRRTGLSGIKDTKSYKFPSFALPKAMPKTLFPRWRRQSGTTRKTEYEDNDDGDGGDYNDRHDRRKENYLSQPALSEPASSSEDPTYDSFSRNIYFTHTGANLSSALEGSNLLEETSLADFLRALTALHARVGGLPSDEFAGRKPRRKMGTASLTPPKLPSLFTLFSPLANGSPSQSNQNTITGVQNPPNRKTSLRNVEGTAAADVTASALRRFSLRAVPTPSGTPPEYGSQILRPSANNTERDRVTPRRSNPPDFYPFESAKQPLVATERAPGFSSPVSSSANLRRFSLKSTQPPEEGKGGPSTVAATKALPRWKAGMLQRQIGRMSVRRRARAFSLSDVNSEPSSGIGSSSPISPLAADVTTKRTFATGRPSTSSIQKTVTIVSPRSERAEATGGDSSSATATKSAKGAKSELFRVSRVFESQLRSENQSDDRSRSVSSLKEGRSKETAFSEMEATNAPVIARAHSTEMEMDANARAAEAETEAVAAVAAFSSYPSTKEGETESGRRASEEKVSSSRHAEKDKPRVSLDTYKPLLELKIEKPSVDPFEQYRAAACLPHNDPATLTEVKVEKVEGAPLHK